MQTVFGANIEFSMRTFLFKTQGSSADEQQQTISCNLHLDPAADVSSTEPDDCSCYSEDECTVPADFTNADGEGYHRTTLSSGKRLLLIPTASTYQNAVDACSSRGSDLLLPIDQAENSQVRDFLNSHYNAGNFQTDPVAWLRVSNPGSGWVDSKTDEALGYEGPDSMLTGYTNTNALVEYSYGHWKGYPGETSYPAIICELPSL